MKTKLKRVLAIAAILLLAIWAKDLIKCEILTHMHYDEFKDAYKKNTMLSDMEYFKVLEYKPYRSEFAQVYYVSKNKTGADVLTFAYNYDTHSWDEISWNTIWSETGSASEVIYPYLWHFIYGGL
ncbi:MAG: hypothetical protein Q4G33_14110 [bacterium]|nr:hypothetical protein [bacterium]